VRTHQRGDVWLANLDPVIGSEQGKPRPVVSRSRRSFASGPAEDDTVLCRVDIVVAYVDGVVPRLPQALSDKRR